MSRYLYLRADRVFDSPSAEQQLVELSNDDILSICGDQPPTIILQDPSYVSDTIEVALNRKSDRHKMAVAKFQQLAGVEGCGSWYIASVQKQPRWYGWAIDSGCKEAERLRELAAAGVRFQSASCEFLLNASGDDCLHAELNLRVLCSETSVQIALMLNGHCIFVRRVDAQSSSPLESLQSTLGYLKSRSYLDDFSTLCWQLNSGAEVLQQLSVLWEGDDASLPAPHVNSNIEQATTNPPLHFNCIGFESEKQVCKRWAQLDYSALAFVALALSYLIPSVLLGTELPAPVAVVELEAEPEKVSARYWQMHVLEQRDGSSASDISVSFLRLVEQVNKQDGVELVALSSAAQEGLKLRCQLSQLVNDPLQRLTLIDEFRHRLINAMPDYQVTVIKGGQFAVGEVRTDSHFEVTMRARRDQG